MTVLLVGCSRVETEPLHFIGKIGGKYMAEITLEKTGDQLAGQFKYIDLKKEPLNLKGSVSHETLRLEEYDEKDNISGIFEGRLRGNAYLGKWKDPISGITVPFNFELTTDGIPPEKTTSRKSTATTVAADRSTTKAASPKSQTFETLEGGELLKKLFYFDHVEPGNFALSQDKTNKTTFDTLLQFKHNNKEHALAYFSNYELDEEGEISLCHLCSGFVSIAKFVKEKDQWLLEDFTKNCECGESSNGSTNPPTKLVSFNNEYTFLQSRGHDTGQGINNGWLNLYNIDDFKQAVSISTDGENSGAVMEGDPTYSFDSKLDFAVCDSLPCIKVSYSGSKPKNDYSKIVYLNEKLSTYIFDPKRKEFNIAQ